MAYRAYGHASPALICINGAQQTMSSWRSFIGALVGHYRVVTFDFPGQGRSHFHSSRVALTVDEHVDIVARVAQAANARPAAVMGASWGSVVAAGYAARYPQDVSQLLLAGFALRPTPALRALVAEGRRLFLQGYQAALGALIIGGFGARLPESLQRMILMQFRTLSHAHAAGFIAHSQLVVDIGDVRRLFDLGAIRAETLVMNGAEDCLVDATELAWIEAQIPRCTTKLVAEAGHFLHLERPAILDDYRAFFVGAAPLKAVRSA